MNHEIAQLRHLYANLVNGGVKDSAGAKRIAEGLLSPVIGALERSHHSTERRCVMGNRHWYCIGKDGIATLCADKDDAEQSAKLASLDWPRNAPYRAVQLVEADELDALKADAERYRWLRNFHSDAIHDDLPHIAAGGDYVGAWALHSEAADEAIDAARARLGEGGAT